VSEKQGIFAVNLGSECNNSSEYKKYIKDREACRIGHSGGLTGSECNNSSECKNVSETGKPVKQGVHTAYHSSECNIYPVSIKLLHSELLI
jgi:hypothetical protein